ncbi:MAG: hypothetical protein ACMUIP_09270, partial [bacterium]
MNTVWQWRAKLLGSILFILFILVSSFAHASPIKSGQILFGEIEPESYEELWTFEGMMGDRILINAEKTGDASSFDTAVCLIDPDGVQEICTASGGDWLDHILNKTGMYTIKVFDRYLAYTGTYAITYINLMSGPCDPSLEEEDCRPIVSGQVLNGSIAVTSDLDFFHFEGKVGDRILINAEKTGESSPFVSAAWLFDPDGQDVIYSPNGYIDHVLEKEGDYIIIVLDNNFFHTGTYALVYINLTSGPCDLSLEEEDCRPIVSGQILNGSIAVTSDLDFFHFEGKAGDRIL